MRGKISRPVALFLTEGYVAELVKGLEEVVLYRSYEKAVEFVDGLEGTRLGWRRGQQVSEIFWQIGENNPFAFTLPLHPPMSFRSQTVEMPFYLSSNPIISQAIALLTP